MTLLQLFWTCYSLETLDTRFTTSSRTLQGSQTDPAKPPPPKEENRNSQVIISQKTASQHTESSPSLWTTPEFLFYYLIFIVCVPLMFKAVYDVSQPSHPNFHKYAELLSPGWIPGRQVDNSDSQYSTFRENVPYMLLLVIIHPLLRRIVNIVYPLKRKATESSASAGAADLYLHNNSTEGPFQRRIAFDLYFALTFLCILHGFSSFKVLLILYINYTLTIRLPRKYVPAAAWMFNIAILFANELGRGYPFAAVARNIGTEQDLKNNWGVFLDSYGGLIPRWEILFNITILRLISFDMDYFWSFGYMRSRIIEKKQLDLANLSERDRVDIPARHEDYSFENYLAYVLYSPLYLAGPILTFNDYIYQSRYTPKSITQSRTILYAVRFVVCLLTMEVMLHFIYAVAISKSQPVWEVYSPFQLSMLGYFNLHIIWLKLLLPWRFFRLWSLLDGIDPPENMVRCMSNNYSAQAFWRGWHRSYNRWIVRYLYIPLGGSGGTGAKGISGKARGVFNLLLVFTFVALWHDINLQVLMWGWLVTLFVLPEVLAEIAFPKRKWHHHKTAYRWLCGIGAVFNILMMMAANLVGFAVGLDGLKGLAQGIVGTYSGLIFLVAACAALFVGSQVMFETREDELRHGIKMKC